MISASKNILNLDSNVMAKLELAKQRNKRIDGHAPFLSNKDLCAYIASGVKSDHECTNPKEAIEITIKSINKIFSFRK